MWKLSEEEWPPETLYVVIDNGIYVINIPMADSKSHMVDDPNCNCGTDLVPNGVRWFLTHSRFSDKDLVDEAMERLNK